MKQIAQVGLEMLARYLQGELGSAVEVRERWFGPEESFDRPKVSCVLVGEPEHLPVQNQVTKSTATVDPNTKLYTWRVNVVRQALQLDAYAPHEAKLDELSVAIMAALRRGEGYTLDASHVPAGVTPIYWGNPVRDGIILALDPASTYDGFAAFLFDGATPIQDAEGARTRDWRAMWRGELGVDLLIQAESPRIARILLSQKTGIGELGTGSNETTEIEEP